MNDIVERLRETIVAYDTWYQGQLKTSDTLLERFSRERKEAAAEITRLREENEKLREALEGMIDLAEAANVMNDPAYDTARKTLESNYD